MEKYFFRQILMKFTAGIHTLQEIYKQTQKNFRQKECEIGKKIGCIQKLKWNK